jgi:hypothetical protein
VIIFINGNTIAELNRYSQKTVKSISYDIFLFCSLLFVHSTYCFCSVRYFQVLCSSKLSFFVLLQHCTLLSVIFIYVSCLLSSHLLSSHLLSSHLPSSPHISSPLLPLIVLTPISCLPCSLLSSPLSPLTCSLFIPLYFLFSFPDVAHLQNRILELTSQIQQFSQKNETVSSLMMERNLNK